MPSNKSDHLNDVAKLETDSTLARLLVDDFDPVDYLNNVLPSQVLSTQSTTATSNRSAQLQDASADIQSLLAKLNSHNIRASGTLTQLTDEILRSGSRLAYEVEILRGDVNNLHTTLTESLRDDVAAFDRAGQSDTGVSNGADSGSLATTGPSSSPDLIQQLEVLQTAKSRLEDTVRTFGSAMNWPLPPPSPTLTSSLISVSAPEFGLETAAAPASASQASTTPTEAQARLVAKALRDEITEMSKTDLAAAGKRIEDLRELSLVWKGTNEEKPRLKFLDSLSKIVEDRRKATQPRSGSRTRLETDLQPQYRSSSLPVRGPNLSSSETSARTSSPARGLLKNLQKLRDEIYLE